MTATTSLTVIQRAQVALASGDCEKHLSELAAKSTSIVAITNPAGRQECHAAAMAAADARIAVQKAAKAAREDATAFSKAVIAEEKRLVDLIEPEEKRLLALRNEWDAAREAEKEAKRRAEAERIAAIQKRVDAIKAIPLESIKHDSTALARAIDTVSSLEIDDSFAELYGAAAEAKADALATLREMHAAKVAAEAEAERQRIEREAEAKRRQEEQAKLEAERAAQAQEAARLKAERESFERQQAEARAAAEAERAAQAKKEAEARKAEQEKLAAERAEIARQQAEIDEQRRQQEAERQRQAEAAAAEERRQAEAAKREQEAKDEAARIEREANERRARIAALIAPSAESVTQLVADQYALGDYATAARWLSAMDFAAENLKAAA